MTATRRLRRWLSAPLVWLAALVIAFEELAWDELSSLMGWLGRLPVLRELEQWIASRSPKTSLLLYLVPMLALLPVKLLAAFAITQGYAVFGLLVILLAKLGGTAILARLFALTQPQLMQLPLFALWYARFLRFKAYINERLAESPTWQAAHRGIQQVRAMLRRPSRWRRRGKWLSRRWPVLRK